MQVNSGQQNPRQDQNWYVSLTVWPSKQQRHCHRRNLPRSEEHLHEPRVTVTAETFWRPQELSIGFQHRKIFRTLGTLGGAFLWRSLLRISETLSGFPSQELYQAHRKISGFPWQEPFQDLLVGFPCQELFQALRNFRWVSLAGAILGPWELFSWFPSRVPFQVLMNFKGFHLRNFSRITETKMV